MENKGLVELGLKTHQGFLEDPETFSELRTGKGVMSISEGL